jgi:hypothetical protein
MTIVGAHLLHMLRHMSAPAAVSSGETNVNSKSSVYPLVANGLAWRWPSLVTLNHHNRVNELTLIKWRPWKKPG